MGKKPAKSEKDEVKKDAEETSKNTHGMSSSELGKVVRTDHDYIELLVKVKAEKTDDEYLKDSKEDFLVPIGNRQLDSSFKSLYQ